MKKHASVLIALLGALAFLLSACSGGGAVTTTAATTAAATTSSEAAAAATTAGTTAAVSTTAAATTAPAETKPVSFSMFHIMSGNVPDGFSYETNWFIETLCEMANVELSEVQVPAYADTATKFNLMMASGEILDLVQYSVLNDMKKYGADGAFLPSEEIIHGSEALSAAISDELLGYVRSEDGNAYIFPTPANNDYNAIFVRQDLLEAAGIDTLPTTLDELVEGARAIKAANPDALPFEGPGVSSFRSNWMTVPFNTAFSGWSYHREKDAYINEWEGDNIVACLNWAKSLLDEGLLDPEFVTTNNDMDNTKKATRDVFAYYGNVGSIRVWIQRVNNAGVGNAKLMPIDLKCADGVGVDSVKLYEPTVGNYCFGINYAVDDEKLAGITRFLEAAYSDEIRELSSYGREGQEHQIVDGTIVPILPNATDNAWISIYGWCSFNSNEKINWLQSIVIQQTAVNMNDSEKIAYQNELENTVWTLEEKVRGGMGVSPVAAIGTLDDTTASLAAEAKEQQLSLFAKALMSEITVEEFAESKDALVAKYQSVTDAYNALYAELSK
ncbi:MAG: extracellular solute-binding protein [Eubacteriales bacterium]|nr:extracellular solute-binding protein [Eubacteriales bacterium]